MYCDVKVQVFADRPVSASQDILRRRYVTPWRHFENGIIGEQMG